MARVILHDPDRSGYDLPDLCMKCGAPAMVYKAKTFTWHPGWINVLIVCGLLPFVFVAIMLTRRLTVCVPLCEAHRNHWLWRFVMICGSFFTLVGVGFASFLLSLEPDPTRGMRHHLTGLVCFACFFGLILWLIVALVLSLTTIRATEITDRSITLAGVCDQFADAYEEDRRALANQGEQLLAQQARSRPDDSWRNSPRYPLKDQKLRQEQRYRKREK